MNTAKKIACCIFLSILTVQSVNANPVIWSGLRWILGNLAKSTVTNTARRTVVKKVVRSAVTGAIINSVTMTGNAQMNDFVFNQHGVILKEKGHTIYIGKDCDTYSPTLGTGHWSWNNYGWSVGMENSEQITFFEYDTSMLQDFPRSILNQCKQ